MKPVFSLALALGLATALPASADTAAATARIDAWLADVETLAATFEQQLLDEAGAVLGASSGEMTLKRPGLFRWHYKQPSELLVLSDGKQIYSYDVELENVTVMQQADALTGSPAQLLAGAGSVADGFEVRAAWSSETVDWFELVPRDGERDFRLLRLGFEADELAAMELHDQLGQVTRIVFFAVSRNEPVAESQFVFVVPEGVDVIAGPESAP